MRPGQNEAQCRSILHSGCSRAQFALQQGNLGTSYLRKTLSNLINTPKLRANVSNMIANHRYFYLPSALEIAKNGTDSVWVLLLTGPLCP